MTEDPAPYSILGRLATRAALSGELYLATNECVDAEVARRLHWDAYQTHLGTSQGLAHHLAASAASIRKGEAEIRRQRAFAAVCEARYADRKAAEMEAGR